MDGRIGLENNFGDGHQYTFAPLTVETRSISLSVTLVLWRWYCDPAGQDRFRPHPAMHVWTMRLEIDIARRRQKMLTFDKNEAVYLHLLNRRDGAIRPSDLQSLYLAFRRQAEMDS